MIQISMRLQCDSCSRPSEIEMSKCTHLPSLPSLLASIGWAQYLNGFVLCQECSQNAETVQRVAQIQQSAIYTRNGNHNGNHDSQSIQVDQSIQTPETRRCRSPRLVSSKVIDALRQCNNSNADAARILGCAPGSINSWKWRQKKDGKPFTL